MTSAAKLDELEESALEMRRREALLVCDPRTILSLIEDARKEQEAREWIRAFADNPDEWGWARGARALLAKWNRDDATRDLRHTTQEGKP